MYVIGGLDDQTNLLVWGRISAHYLAGSPIYSQVFRNLLHPLSTNQPLMSLLLSVFLPFFGSNSFNYLLLLTLLLNIIFSYLFFKKHRFWFVYVMIFVFSSYTWSHIGIHIDLLQIWIFPCLLYLIEKYESDLKPLGALKLGAFMAISLTISNYYGAFSALLFLVYFLIKFLLMLMQKRLFNFDVVRFCGITLSVFFLLSSLFVYPFIREVNESFAVKEKLTRPYEDFFTFSSRPWYFFIPPVKNPWLGDFSGLILGKLAATNYFLTDDYFSGEHSGNYLGMLFLVSVSAVFLHSVFRSSGDLKFKSTVYLISAMVFISFMMPPFFTISGVKIYTPGYVFPIFLPMFRVTARLSVLVHLLLLAIFGCGMEFIHVRYSDKSRLISAFLFTVMLVTLLEVYVPLKVQKMATPEVYTFLSAATGNNTKFAVYPYNKTDDALYWLPVHESELLNPRWYKNTKFDSEKFTKNLNTSAGLQALVDLDGKYLVVYKGIAQSDVEFFKANAKLGGEFADAYLFEV